MYFILTNLGTLRRYAAAAIQHNIPLIMFETNTASCAGFSGISDSFGAALWAVGALFFLYLPDGMVNWNILAPPLGRLEYAAGLHELF